MLQLHLHGEHVCSLPLARESSMMSALTRSSEMHHHVAHCCARAICRCEANSISQQSAVNSFLKGNTAYASTA